MSEPNCSSCRFWEAAKGKLPGGDDKAMDIVRLCGWCEKHRAPKFTRERCNSYEPQLQYQKQ